MPSLTVVGGPGFEPPTPMRALPTLAMLLLPIHSTFKGEVTSSTPPAEQVVDEARWLYGLVFADGPPAHSGGGPPGGGSARLRAAVPRAVRPWLFAEDKLGWWPVRQHVGLEVPDEVCDVPAHSYQAP